MIIGMLPPAGDPVTLARDPAAQERLLERWRSYRPEFYRSGTDALAAAIAAALALRPGRRDVILPGYGCPALVSAVVHAGGRPRLVDLAPDAPWMALDQVRAAADGSAAIVAVNFLGIPERLSALRDIARRADAVLIEDSAQAYPPAGLEGADADFAVLSFGRGKPVSLLGGGAVLSRAAELAAALPRPPATAEPAWRPHAKALAYNWLRRPALYWLPQALPLGLGETRYQPLHRIDGMDRDRLQCLGHAVETYQHRAPDAQRRLRARLRAHGALLDLSLGCAPDRRLLRYPLLAPSAAVRETLLQALNRAGLGASAMYGRVLPEVEGVPAGLDAGPLPAARDFAARLLTLPVHQGVRSPHVDRMCAVIASVLQDGERAVTGYQTEKTG